jgi:hypothetical protein
MPRRSGGARLVTPRTLLCWHRALARGKWRQPPGRRGRPPVPAEVRAVVLRLARENPRCGDRRISGELTKLGLRVSPTTVRRLLAHPGLDPAPRSSGPGWREFLHDQAASIVVCDFFIVESVLLRRYHVFFFIAHASRRVALKNLKLVAKHHDLELLELRRAETQRGHRQRTPKQQVQHRNHHAAASLTRTRRVPWVVSPHEAGITWIVSSGASSRSCGTRWTRVR